MNKTVPNYKLYRDPDTDLSCEPVHVDDVVFSSRRHNWVVDPHRHDDLYQLVLFRHGHGRLQLEDKVYRFDAPIFLLVPPTAVHAFDMSYDLAGEVVSVTSDFLTKLMTPSAGCIDSLHHPWLYHGETHAGLLREMDALFQQMKTEYNGRLVARNLTLQSLLGMVVSMLLRYRDRDQQSESKWGVEHPGQRYYRQFQNQIGQKLSARVSIADHAARLRISTTHLNRVCRDLAGKSALDVVHDRIITEAKRSLTYTVLPVASIAYQLGFNDPSYFSRFFKTKTGYSPRQYQHQVRLQV